MEPTTLLLGYTPLAVAALLPVFTIWEASIRRNSRRSVTATLQAVFGVAMLVSAGGAVWISVETLASYSLADDTTQGSALVIFAASYVLFAAPTIGTLIVGLARPSRPLPRRGLTIVVLVTTAVLVSVGALYCARNLPGAIHVMLSGG
jgi:hypothetical protein